MLATLYLWVVRSQSTRRTGKVIGKDDIELQTRITCENITKVLREAGADWRNIVKLNTYYVYNGPDEGALEFWQKMTKVRLEFFADPGPAGTAVRVAGLADPGPAYRNRGNCRRG